MNAPWQRWCRLTGVRHPILQDGMGPGPTTHLAIAVSSAGGLGTVSVPSLSGDPADIRRVWTERIREVAAQASGPFAVNVPVGRVPSGELLPVTETCIASAIELKRSVPEVDAKMVAITTSAGFPGEYSERIRDAGLLHQHKVGSLTHARKAALNGADVVIASGYEAGGHTHDKPVHTMVLAPQVIAELDRPVLVAGGIYDGRGLAAALAMGAAGVSMGTRFVATVEHEWHLNYKRKIVDCPEWGDTVFPGGFYAPVRGLRSTVLAKLEEAERTMAPPEYAAWKERLLNEAQMDGHVEGGLMPAGQCAAAVHDIIPVRDVIEEAVAQCRSLLAAAAQAAADLHATDGAVTVSAQ
jgi:NAD(P)H-dependent flavin oxidoreductase YrpB (nitropropane dioxygenase family)